MYCCQRKKQTVMNYQELKNWDGEQYKDFVHDTQSAVSDTCSNSIRVVKVYKQTNVNANISYFQCAVRSHCS